MSTTLEQLEALPDDYPRLKPAVPDAVWARLEGYIAWRFSPRSVVWIVEGCGEWKAPLTPATISTIEVWSDRAKAWETATLDAAPLGGFYLPCTGPYRFSAMVGGDDDVPAIVAQAAQLLAAYMAASPGDPGATRTRDVVAGVGETELWRSESWMARAMRNSGAADLLRNFRRA